MFSVGILLLLGFQVNFYPTAGTEVIPSPQIFPHICDEQETISCSEGSKIFVEGTSFQTENESIDRNEANCDEFATADKLRNSCWCRADCDIRVDGDFKNENCADLVCINITFFCIPDIDLQCENFTITTENFVQTTRPTNTVETSRPTNTDTNRTRIPTNNIEARRPTPTNNNDATSTSFIYEKKVGSRNVHTVWVAIVAPLTAIIIVILVLYHFKDKLLNSCQRYKNNFTVNNQTNGSTLNQTANSSSEITIATYESIENNQKVPVDNILHISCQQPKTNRNDEKEIVYNELYVGMDEHNSTQNESFGTKNLKTKQVVYDELYNVKKVTQNNKNENEIYSNITDTNTTEPTNTTNDCRRI